MGKEIIDINERLIQQFVDSIRPKDLEIRKQVDMGYTYTKQVVELLEIRPDWMDPKIIRENAFARIRFYKTKKIWKLYWMRSSGKWELYEPFPDSTHLENIIKTIEEDKHGCFLDK